MSNGGCEYVIIAETTMQIGETKTRGRHRERERLIKRKQEWRMSDITAGFCLRAYSMWNSLLRDKSPIINYKRTEYQFYIRFVMINCAFNAYTAWVWMKNWRWTRRSDERLHFYKFMSEKLNDVYMCVCAQAQQISIRMAWQMFSSTQRFLFSSCLAFSH